MVKSGGAQPTTSASAGATHLHVFSSEYLCIGPSPQPLGAPPPSQATQSPAAQPFLPGFGNAAAGFGDLSQMQNQMMQNPEMLQQMLNSPMMQSLLNDPEMMNSMILNNPQLQAMMNANPQIRHILNDPEVVSDERCVAHPVIVDETESADDVQSQCDAGGDEAPRYGH
jgi:hypothetical protein